MRAKYKFFPEQGLLVEVFYGPIGLRTLVEILQQQARHPEFASFTKLLTDLRKAEITISASELKDYLDELEKTMSERKLKWAVIAEDPRSTALSLLAGNHRVFRDSALVVSTLPSAADFLNITASLDPLRQEDGYEVLV